MSNEIGHLTCDLKPGQAICFEIPKKILEDLAKGIDSDSLRVTVTHITKLGRSSRFKIEAPRVVRISKP
jgi:hypothetical protein